MPRKSRLFLPLLRNKGASFPHALRCLSAGNTFPAIRAVFDAVGRGCKGRAAHGTTPLILRRVKLGVQFFIKGQYGGAKPLAEQGKGNKLRADTFLPVVQ